MAQGFTSGSVPIMKMGGARVYRSTNQTLTTGASTVVASDTVVYDDAGFWDPVTFAFVIPPGFGGRYTLTGWIYLGVSTTGLRILWFDINGAFSASQRVPPSGSNTDGLTVSVTLDLVAGDAIKLYAYQNSGGNVDIQSGSVPANFTIQRVGLAAGTAPTGPITSSALTCNDNVLLGRVGAGSSGVIQEVLYSFGAYTPTFTFATPGNLSVSYANQIGYYQRIGNVVQLYVRMTCTPTHTTASGVAIISLPFQASGTYLNRMVCQIITNGVTWPTSTTMTHAVFQAGTTNMLIESSGSGATRTQWTTAQFPTATQRDVIISGYYIAA